MVKLLKEQSHEILVSLDSYEVRNRTGSYNLMDEESTAGMIFRRKLPAHRREIQRKIRLHLE
jgi:hypothetical protein